MKTIAWKCEDLKLNGHTYLVDGVIFFKWNSRTWSWNWGSYKDYRNVLTWSTKTKGNSWYVN